MEGSMGVKSLAAFMALLASSGAAAPALPAGIHFIPGAVPLNSGPDGNTIVFDAPKGLIVFDTGRHPEHAQAILDYAKQRGRPIAAIMNSHWHMDHVQGNADIRQVYPRAQVYATTAVDGALQTFLADGRKSSKEELKDPKTTPTELTEIR